MFRHSEIQTLLRERRHRIEAGEDVADVEAAMILEHDRDMQEEGAVISAAITDGADLPGEESAERGHAHSHVQETGNHKKKSKKRKKRPRRDDDDDDAVQQWTHRRLAREQDHVFAAEKVELDYGD